MKLKVFTFRLEGGAVGFEDSAMTRFLEQKEVVQSSEHFFVHENVPYLSLVVSYRESSAEEVRRYNRWPDFKKDLDDTEKRVYDAPRTWRAVRSRQEGLPPYVIAANAQLSKMIRPRAATKADLLRIDGFGEAKAALYAQEILAIIDRTFGPNAARQPGDPGDGARP